MRTICFLFLFIVLMGCDDSSANSTTTSKPKKDPTIAIVTQFMNDAPNFDGFAIDKSGQFIAASGYTSTSVYKFSDINQSKVLTSKLSGPVHVLINKKEEVLVSNFADGTIKVIHENDSISTFVSGLDAPVGMIQDNSGNIYVVNYGANFNGKTVSRISSDGKKSTFINDALISGPIDVAIASDNNVYVANYNNGQLIKVSGGKTSKLLELPQKQINHMLFFKGYFYLTCSKDNKLYRSNLAGMLEVFAGGDSKLTKKLDASVPNFVQLNGIATDGKDLFVSSGTGNIWKIEFLSN
jgi:6-phosphogluconolactonase (cycloisomerase 2 family)